VITRWQAARGYPKSGYLNKLQHKALLTEIVATQPASASSGSDEDDKPAAPRRRASGGGGGGGGSAPAPRQHSGGGGGDPANMGRFMGGVIGGVLR
jgi:hypothetical protein